MFDWMLKHLVKKFSPNALRMWMENNIRSPVGSNLIGCSINKHIDYYLNTY